MRLLVALLVWFLRAVFTTRGAVAPENLALRQQLASYTRAQKRPRLRPVERVFWVAKAHQVASDQQNVFSSDRGAKYVFAECFTTDGVVCSGGGCGMKRKAVCGGTEPLGILELTAFAEPDGILLA